MVTARVSAVSCSAVVVDGRSGWDFNHDKGGGCKVVEQCKACNYPL